MEKLVDTKRGMYLRVGVRLGAGNTRGLCSALQSIEGQDSIIVHPGLLQSDSLAPFTSSGLGLSLAFEPKKEHFIKRGDPIAKLLVFHKSALTLLAEVVEGVEMLEPLERT
jgi:hypothetical protein